MIISNDLKLKSYNPIFIDLLINLVPISSNNYVVLHPSLYNHFIRAFI